MKNMLFLLTAIIIAACGQTGNDQEKLAGTWHITSISGGEKLQPCEEAILFHFTNEATEVANQAGWILSVEQGTEPCDFPGPEDNYTSAYTFSDGQLFIKKLRLLNNNYSGVMQYTFKDDKTMVLTAMQDELTFKKVE